MEGYDHPNRLLIAVDCLVFTFIEGRLHLLIIRNTSASYSHEWSLMGDFINHDETLDEAAARVLAHLTGVSGVYLEQFRAFGSLDRDEIERTISVAYYALVNHEDVDRQITSDYSARWASVFDLPVLGFDHSEMVTAALRRLRYRAIHEPVILQMLGDRFTLTELQASYESIFQTAIDAGNFRRRLRRMNYLEQLAEKDQRYSKKGAYLYRFREDLFAEAVAGGAEFLLKP